MNKLSVLRSVGRGARLSLALLLIVAVLPARQTAGAELWTGPAVDFTNLLGSDPTLPENQDRLTLFVWLTRGPTQGLYNAAVESGYTHSLSPVGTEWAYGALADHASLIYQNWESWNGGAPGGPPSTVGRDAVLHLIPDDVYLSIRFTFWNTHGGGFSYTRSSPPVPEPSAAVVMLAGAATLAVLRFRRQRLPPPQTVPRRVCGAQSSLAR
jgi:hypothetical protein